MDRNKIILEQCIAHEMSFRNYFEDSITPIYEKSIEDAFLAAKMIDEDVINTLKGYSTIFRKCSLPRSENSKRYSLIDANLFLLASLMEEVQYFYNIKPDTVSVPFILVREKYKVIFWILSDEPSVPN